MVRRIVTCVAVAAAVAVTAAPAEAAAWNGSCALNVTFNFTSPVLRAGLTVTRPSYTISVTPAADLNPLTGVSEPCEVAPGGLSPFRETSVTAGGTSSLWTCEATDAGGTWNQSWNPSPPAVSGSHVITGGPGGWTMVLHNSPTLTFVGVMHLVVHPSDALKLAQCEVSGMSSLRMTGVLEFQLR